MIQLKLMPAVICLAGFLVLSSCKKEAPIIAPPGQEPYANSLVAKIDENLWVATFFYPGANDERISIYGTHAGSSMLIQMPRDIIPEVYPMSTFGPYLSQYVPGSSPSLGSETGHLVISEHNEANRTIKGTFSYTAKAFGGDTTTAEVEGSFDVRY